MKKYISLFSLLAFFFMGIQNSQAQELERRSLDETKGQAKKESHRKAMEKAKAESSPEHQAKLVDLKQEEARTDAKNLTQKLAEVAELSAEQYDAVNNIYLDMSLKLLDLGDDKSEKAQNEKTLIKTNTEESLAKILNEEQYEQYMSLQEKLAKAEK